MDIKEEPESGRFRREQWGEIQGTLKGTNDNNIYLSFFVLYLFLMMVLCKSILMHGCGGGNGGFNRS